MPPRITHLQAVNCHRNRGCLWQRPVSRAQWTSKVWTHQGQRPAGQERQAIDQPRRKLGAVTGRIRLDVQDDSAVSKPFRDYGGPTRPLNNEVENGLPAAALAAAARPYTGRLVRPEHRGRARQRRELKVMATIVGGIATSHTPRSPRQGCEEEIRDRWWMADLRGVRAGPGMATRKAARRAGLYLQRPYDRVLDHYSHFALGVGGKLRPADEGGGRAHLPRSKGIPAGAAHRHGPGRRRVRSVVLPGQISITANSHRFRSCSIMTTKAGPHKWSRSRAACDSAEPESGAVWKFGQGAAGLSVIPGRHQGGHRRHRRPSHPVHGANGAGSTTPNGHGIHGPARKDPESRSIYRCAAR